MSEDVIVKKYIVYPEQRSSFQRNQQRFQQNLSTRDLVNSQSQGISSDQLEREYSNRSNYKLYDIAKPKTKDQLKAAMNFFKIVQTCKNRNLRISVQYIKKVPYFQEKQNQIATLIASINQYTIGSSFAQIYYWSRKLPLVNILNKVEQRVKLECIFRIEQRIAINFRLKIVFKILKKRMKLFFFDMKQHYVDSLDEYMYIAKKMSRPILKQATIDFEEENDSGCWIKELPMQDMNLIPVSGLKSLRFSSDILTPRTLIGKLEQLTSYENSDPIRKSLQRMSIEDLGKAAMSHLAMPKLAEIDEISSCELIKEVSESQEPEYQIQISKPINNGEEVFVSRQIMMMYNNVIKQQTVFYNKQKSILTTSVPIKIGSHKLKRQNTEEDSSNLNLAGSLMKRRLKLKKNIQVLKSAAKMLSQNKSNSKKQQKKMVDQVQSRDKINSISRTSMFYYELEKSNNLKKFLVNFGNEIQKDRSFYFLHLILTFTSLQRSDSRHSKQLELEKKQRIYRRKGIIYSIIFIWFSILIKLILSYYLADGSN